MTDKKKQNPPKQDDSFESVARRLECDEDKATFEANLGKVAKASSDKGKRSK